MLDSITTFWNAFDPRSRAPLVLPLDSPIVVMPGPDPDKVLLVGSGPAAGAGVTSHRQALTGAMARQLVEHSRRGAIVEAIGRANMRLEHVPQLLGDSRIERFDAVVVTTGLIKALAQTSKRSWTRAVETVLDTVHPQQPRDGTVIITGIPVSTSSRSTQGSLGRVTDRHAAGLNRISHSLVTARQYGHFVPLTAPPATDGHPTPASYSTWATDICTVLEPLLSGTARQSQSFTDPERATNPDLRK